MKDVLKYFLTYALAFGSYFCFSQSANPQISKSSNSQIDSLLNVVQAQNFASLHDTSKINTLNELSWELKNNKPDTAIILCTRALALAEATKWQKGIAGSLRNLGAYNYLKGNYPQALQHYFKALKINEELKDKKGISATLGNIGIVYRNQGDYSKALDYYLKALKIGEELGDKNRIAIQLGNIGIVYDNQKDYPKALDYYFRALKMDEELGNKNNIAAWLGNIGSVYDEQASTASPDNPNNVAINSAEQERLYNKALDYFFMALKIAEELGSKNRIAADLGNIGSLYTSLKKYKKAEDYLKQALTIDTAIGSVDGQKYRHEDLSKLYSQTGKHKLALEHYKHYIIYRDSLLNAENTKKSIRTEINYDFDKKEAAAKAEQEKKDAIVKEEKQRQAVIRNSLIGGFVLVLVLTLVVLRSYRQKQNANRELALKNQKIENAYKVIEEQKQLVEEKHKIVQEKQEEILDSIRYAKRIQTAFIASEKYIDKNLKKLIEEK